MDQTIKRKEKSEICLIFSILFIVLTETELINNYTEGINYLLFELLSAERDIEQSALFLSTGSASIDEGSFRKATFPIYWKETNPSDRKYLYSIFRIT